MLNVECWMLNVRCSETQNDFPPALSALTRKTRNMRSKVIAGSVALALALGLMVVVKRGEPSPPPVGPSEPARALSAQRESGRRPHASSETPPAGTESATN